MKLRKASFWVGTFCFLSFMAFGLWMAFGAGKVVKTPGTANLSSQTNVETPEQCGADRNYLLRDLARVSSVYTRSRSSVGQNDPPKECVTYIMQNFIPLDTKSIAMSQCRGERGERLDSPTKGSDGAGFKPPCATDAYVNSVYNSLVDVGDCLNIPVKELLPKLFNESGLHVNTLGGGFDGGVGQLTVSALREVFMRYDSELGNPSALDWYVKEMAKSSKSSCQRILAERSAYQIPIPAGMKSCFSGEASDADCYMPWASANRCVVMSLPESPLRNVLFTGVFYRSLLKNATGIGYSAGADVLNGHLFQEGDRMGGYIGAGDFVARLQNLGVKHADSNVLKQMIVSMGFNAGIRSGKIYLDNYLKQREARNESLSDSDVDFQNTDTGKWAIVTNLPTFWRGLATPDEAALDKAISSFEVLRQIGISPKSEQTNYRALRPYVQRDLSAINDDSDLSAAEKTAKINELKVKYDKYRHPLVQAVFAKSAELTLPEYMRIAHAYSIAFDPSSGGAPGYLSFIASKHKQLEKDMGVGVCTANKYLQF